MKYLRVLASAATLLVTFYASGANRPLPLSPVYLTPAPPGYETTGAAFEGDWMIVSSAATFTDPQSDWSTATVWLYRRGGLGPWVLQRMLVEVPFFYDWNTTGVSLAMENGLLVFEIAGTLYVYERGTAGYTQTTVLQNGFNSGRLRIDGQRILAGLGNCRGAAVVEKNGAGAWAISGTLQTTGASCDPDLTYTDGLDFSGDYALVSIRANAANTQAFRRIPGELAWSKTATLPTHDDHFANTPVALRGPLALTAGDSNEGMRVFRRAGASGATWNRIGTLRPVDVYASANQNSGPRRQRNELWLLGNDLWRQNADDSFEQRFRVDGVDVFCVDVGGRTAVAWPADRKGIATYILPATFSASPPPLRDDFQGGGNISWDLGNGFTYAQSGFTRVLRSTQPILTAEAIAIGSDWLNQSIQVDVRPTAFDGSGSYIGLSARRADANNFYQARFSQNQVRLIRRTQTQGDVELATAGVPFTANHTYRLRFETRDGLLHVFVDGAQIISVSDRELTHGGVGLVAESTLADFDNVIVSPLWTSLFAPVDLPDHFKWTASGGTWVDDFQSTPRAHRQTDKLVAARSLTGVPETDDQIVETSVRINSLPPDGDRWVGVIARYHDDGNLYYASLRVNSGLQIRRVANGAVTVLAAVPFTVVGNRDYRLRLEAVGDQLRVYVDGVFLAEAHDTVFAAGRYGVATNRAAASFFDMSVSQP